MRVVRKVFFLFGIFIPLFAQADPLNNSGFSSSLELVIFFFWVIVGLILATIITFVEFTMYDGKWKRSVWIKSLLIVYAIMFLVYLWLLSSS